jgi:hypothetical protein
MASMLDARCTCEAWWRGRWPRPWCPVHERAQAIVAEAERYLRTHDENGAPIGRAATRRAA